MSTEVYLWVMVGIIAVVTCISVPSLFWKKCPQCGKRNGLDATVCKACGADYPEDELLG